MTKTVMLTDEQHEQLMGILDRHKDAGGDFGGYQSDTLQALIATLGTALESSLAERETDLPDEPINFDAPPSDGPHVVEGIWWCRTHDRQLSECMNQVEPRVAQLVRPSPWIPTRK